MQAALALYPGFAALDLVGPYQVLVETPGIDVVLCADRPGPVEDEAGILRIDVEHTFDQVRSPDILLVPGGPGSRVRAAADGPVVDWIRAAHDHTVYTASVCTGALLLGAAGLLRGVPVTTHWAVRDQLRTFGAEPVEQRVVVHDRIATSAGVSAGIELGLTLVDRLTGPEVAQAVQLGIEYDPQPPFDAGSPSKADPAIRDLVAAAVSSH